MEMRLFFLFVILLHTYAMGVFIRDHSSFDFAPNQFLGGACLKVSQPPKVKNLGKMWFTSAVAGVLLHARGIQRKLFIKLKRNSDD